MGNADLWTLILQLGIIGTALLVANALRYQVRWIRKSLMPTAALAGFLLLFLRFFGNFGINTDLFKNIIYHSIAIGFVALSLQIPTVKKNKKNKAGLLTGILIVSVYLVQGIFGLIISLFLAYTFMPGLFKASGLLLPMSFGQGSGQANNIGKTFETLGFSGGTDFGLALAAIGYLCACIVGVAYVAYLVSKKKIRISDEKHLAESVSLNEFQDKDEIPISSSVDKLSIQVALILLAYLITYGIIYGFTTLLSTYVVGLAKLLNPIMWGFNFIIAAAVAILLRSILTLLKDKNILKRQYQNNYLLGRISGFAFDLMIVAGIASIDLKNLSGLWIPFILLVIGGASLTLVFLKKVCKRIYLDYYYEGMLSLYGMLTGTISSGILLLREIDPKFKTPAANNLVIGSSFAIIFGAPMLILLGLAPISPSMTFLVLGLIIAYFAFLLFLLYLFSRKKD